MADNDVQINFGANTAALAAGIAAARAQLNAFNADAQRIAQTMISSGRTTDEVYVGALAHARSEAAALSGVLKASGADIAATGAHAISAGAGLGFYAREARAMADELASGRFRNFDGTLINFAVHGAQAAAAFAAANPVLTAMGVAVLAAGGALAYFTVQQVEATRATERLAQQANLFGGVKLPDDQIKAYRAALLQVSGVTQEVAEQAISAFQNMQGATEASIGAMVSDFTLLVTAGREPKDAIRDLTAAFQNALGPMREIQKLIPNLTLDQQRYIAAAQATGSVTQAQAAIQRAFAENAAANADKAIAKNNEMIKAAEAAKSAFADFGDSMTLGASNANEALDQQIARWQRLNDQIRQAQGSVVNYGSALSATPQTFDQTVQAGLSAGGKFGGNKAITDLESDIERIQGALRALGASGQAAGSAIGTGLGTAATQAGALGRTVSLTTEDIDKIAKVTQTEVAPERLIGHEEWLKQVQATNDAMLNRLASGKYSSVDEMLNAPKQFSAISGNANAYGSVANAPAASPEVLAATTASILARASGARQDLTGGGTQFLNPAFSSPGALAQWGNAVVGQGRGYGRGDSTQYYGTSPGAAPVGPYSINAPGAAAGAASPESAAAGAQSAQNVRELTTELAAAQAKLAELKTAQAGLTETQKADLAIAQAGVTTRQNEVNVAQQKLTAARADLATQQGLNASQTVIFEKTKAVADAQTAVTTATNRATEAQAQLSAAQASVSARATGDLAAQRNAELALAAIKMQAAGQNTADQARVSEEIVAINAKYNEAVLAQTVQTQEAVIKKAEEAASAQKSSLDALLKEHNITEQSWLSQTTNALNTEKAAVAAAFDAEIAAAQNDYSRRTALELQKVEALNAIDKQQQTAQQQAAESYAKTWQSATQAVNNAFDSQIGPLLNHTETLGQAAKKILIDITEQLAKFALNSALTGIENLGKSAFTGAAAAGAGTNPIQSVIQVLTTAMGLNTVATTVNTTATQTASVASFFPHFATGTPFVPNDMAAILHKGEMILPAAANPMNPRNTLASFDTGAWNIPQDQMAYVHKGEMIPDASQSAGLRNLIEGGGGGSQGGGRGGGGGALHLHPTMNFNVSAIDSHSFEQYAKDNSAELARAMEQSARHGAFLGSRRLSGR